MLGLIGLWAILIVAYRWLDPPVTPLMLLRWPESGKIERTVRPLAAISPELQRAVIAAEDNRFCMHRGIDWTAVGEAVEEYQADGRLRGASTITMQTARNLFLWPGGGFVRKAVEAPLALAIDFLWPKRRILEVYLNIIEWGPGIYGTEAAARAVYRTSAANLSRQQAATLAAVLPSPLRWSASRPSGYVASRAGAIAGRIARMDGYFGCILR